MPSSSERPPTPLELSPGTLTCAVRRAVHTHPECGRKPFVPILASPRCSCGPLPVSGKPCRVLAVGRGSMCVSVGAARVPCALMSALVVSKACVLVANSHVSSAQQSMKIRRPSSTFPSCWASHFGEGSVAEPGQRVAEIGQIRSKPTKTLQHTTKIGFDKISADFGRVRSEFRSKSAPKFG